MASTAYYTFYCPYCGRKSEERSSHRLERSGDPRMTCPKCGKTYADPYCQETAFSPFLASPSSPWGIAVLLLGLLVCIAATLLLCSLFGARFTVNLWVALAILGVCLLVFGFFALQCRKSDLEDFKQWQDSDRRLKNPEYACMLYRLGYPVPFYYLPTFEERTKIIVRTEIALIRGPNDLEPAPKTPSNPPKKIPSPAKPSQPSKQDKTAPQYKLHCPHCDFLLDTKTTLAVNLSKPVKTCPYCARPYADPYGTEASLIPYPSASVFKQLLSAFFSGIGAGVILAFNVFILTWSEPLTVAVFCAVSLVSGVFSFVRKLFSLRKSRQEYQTLWKESDLRLQDPTYALLMKQAGFYVPARYLSSYDSDQNPESGSIPPLKLVRLAPKPKSSTPALD